MIFISGMGMSHEEAVEMQWMPSSATQILPDAMSGVLPTFSA
jgi:hypothetical protein